MTDEQDEVAPAAGEAEPSAVKMIEATVFNSLLDDCLQKAERVASINGGVRERIGHHVEKSNLNARVFGWSKAIAKKAGTNTHDALTMLAHARYQFELVEERIRRQHALELEETAGEDTEMASDEADADAVAAAANGVALTDGIKETRKPPTPEDIAAKHQRQKERRAEKQAKGGEQGASEELKAAEARIAERDRIKANADKLSGMPSAGNA